jgi:hypothetical protein
VNLGCRKESAGRPQTRPPSTKSRKLRTLPLTSRPLQPPQPLLQRRPLCPPRQPRLRPQQPIPPPALAPRSSTTALPRCPLRTTRNISAARSPVLSRSRPPTMSTRLRCARPPRSGSTLSRLLLHQNLFHVKPRPRKLGHSRTSFHVKPPPPRARTRTTPNPHGLWMTTPWKLLLTREFIHRSLWMKLGANPPRPPRTSSSGQVPHLLEWAL